MLLVPLEGSDSTSSRAVLGHPFGRKVNCRKMPNRPEGGRLTVAAKNPPSIQGVMDRSGEWLRRRMRVLFLSGKNPFLFAFFC